MGDWLRRLLYPLVLPVVVGTVWLCGWVRQQDDRAAQGRFGLPPVVTHQPWRNSDPAPSTPRERNGFFASAEVEEVVDEP